MSILVFCWVLILLASTVYSFSPRDSQTSSASRVLLHANGESSANWWEPQWTDVEILSNKAACASGRCRAIRVNAPESLQQEYRAPGQYIQVRNTGQDDQDQDDAPLLLCFLPIASSPRKDYFEFLVKDNNNEEKKWLLDLPVGTQLQLSGVLGKGFQPREIPTMKPATTIMDAESIIMACNGLGLASLKAAIESGRLPKGKLYYGERTADDLCFADQFEEWEDEFGFQVIPVLSQKGDSDDVYREGYVQDALAKDGLDGNPDQCYALVCGVMEMMDSVTDFLKGEGVSPTRIMLNLEA